MGGNPNLKRRELTSNDHVISLTGPLDARHPTDGVDPKKLTRVKALIDTGATTSCVNTELAQHLGLVPLREIQVGTADGVVPAKQSAMIVGFQPEDREQIILRVLPMAILKGRTAMIFGMTEIMGGSLIVDGPNEVWKWRVPASRVRPALPR